MTTLIDAQTIPQTQAARAGRLAHYLLKGMGKTIRKYHLLDSGDRVLVAVSGGKDSLSLLDLLYRRQSRAKEQIDILACHVRSDHHCGRAAPEAWLADYCAERNIPFESIPVAIAEMLSQARKSRCFWCAWRRRTALFQLADRLGCNKLAFGHHADDVAETVLLNLCFNGSVRRMEPKQSLFQGRLTVIRPLAMTEERDIVPFARASGFPLQGEPCPDGLNSRRSLVKRVLRELEQDSIHVKRSIYYAVERCQMATQSGVEYDRSQTETMNDQEENDG